MNITDYRLSYEPLFLSICFLKHCVKWCVYEWLDQDRDTNSLEANEQKQYAQLASLLFQTLWRQWFNQARTHLITLSLGPCYSILPWNQLSNALIKFKYIFLWQHSPKCVLRTLNPMEFSNCGWSKTFQSCMIIPPWRYLNYTVIWKSTRCSRVWKLV